MPADWKKIKAEYVQGGTSYRKLAEKYGVSLSSIYRRTKVEKWADLRRQSEEKANTKIVESVASRKARSADQFDIIADKLLKMIGDGLEDGSITLIGKSLRDVTGALKDLREIKGLKSELDLQEQIARIEKLRKDTAPDETANEVRVVISSELEKYSK